MLENALPIVSPSEGGIRNMAMVGRLFGLISLLCMGMLIYLSLSIHGWFLGMMDDRVPQTRGACTSNWTMYLEESESLVEPRLYIDGMDRFSEMGDIFILFR